MKFSLLSLLALSVDGKFLRSDKVTSVGECKPVTTQPDFDLTSYANGKWYIHQQQEVSVYV